MIDLRLRRVPSFPTVLPCGLQTPELVTGSMRLYNLNQYVESKPETRRRCPPHFVFAGLLSYTIPAAPSRHRRQRVGRGSTEDVGCNKAFEDTGEQYSISRLPKRPYIHATVMRGPL